MNTETVVGEYFLSEKISEGGMGDVFRARHRANSVDVCIKLLKERLINDELCRAMFRSEACYMRWLHHRSIPTLIEYVEADGERPAIVMNIVEGISVFAVTREYHHNVPIPDIFWIILRTLDALEHMHSFGIIHNDVKPANIMFDRATRHVTLLDLGCCHPADTMDNEFIVTGTHGFVAPERMTDSRVSSAADIYSLGVTAASMIGFKDAFVFTPVCREGILVPRPLTLPSHPLKRMIEALTVFERMERPQTAALAREIVLDAQQRYSAGCD